MIRNQYKKSIVLLIVCMISSYAFLPSSTSANPGDGASIRIDSLVPNPADNSITATGGGRGATTSEGNECGGGHGGQPQFIVFFTNYPLGNPNFIVTDQSGSQVASGPYNLTQTSAGGFSNCINRQQPPHYEYSYSLPLDTTGYANGTYTLTVQATDQYDSSIVSAQGSFTIGHAASPPQNGTITVTSNNSGGNWVFPSSAGNPCGACAGTSQTYTNQPTGIYNFSAGSIYATSEVSSSSATGAASCSSGIACNLTPNDQINFTANYTNTTCTVAVQGYFNGTTQAATNQSFSISGAGNANGTDTSGYSTFTLPADSSGTNYNFIVNSPANGITVNGFASDYSGVNSSSLSCTPGQTIVFQIQYSSKPVLNVQ